MVETIVNKVQWKNGHRGDNIKNNPLGDNIKRRQNFAYCSSNKRASIQMRLLV